MFILGRAAEIRCLNAISYIGMFPVTLGRHLLVSNEDGKTIERRLLIVK